ncbi:MAG: response regulator [Candidatus Brocadiales bacterium]|nr:response regulator [Candidatus Bathyanammoxibius sp.]
MKILIVDDDKDARALQERVLAAQGYTVESAAKGKEALEMARRSRPDLIISDILMPEMDGFALCQAVKDDEKLRTIPFVFLTASYITREDEKLAVALGAERFLVKTGDIVELLETVEEILKKYKEGHIKVPSQPTVDKEELERMHKDALIRELDKKMRELEREHKALVESEEELKTHARQQEVVSKFGLYALKEIDLQELMNEAVSMVAKTLDVEYCKVLELLPDGKALLLKAGVGWKEGHVGRTTVGTKKDSQAGYTLLSSAPVIVEDLRKETRFSGPPLLLEHGVVSGMSVVIHGKDRPFGVLGTHTTRRRKFTKYDLNFFQTLANVLAEAIQRKRAEEELQESSTRTIQILESITDAFFTLDHKWRFVYLNSEAERLLLRKREELIGNNVWEEFPEAVGSTFYNEYHRAISEQVTVAFEEFYPPLNTWFEVHAYPSKDGLSVYFRDITERRRTEEECKQSLERLRKALGGTIEALAATVETRDPYTAGHQQRVTSLACAMAEEMGLPAEQIDGIRMAATVHDIGKIAVPAEILSKTGKITKTEFEMIKRHSEVGYNILKSIEFPRPIAKIVLQHHERMDGSGYPDALEVGGIFMEARILGVADVVEAMSSYRPYRPALGIDAALEEISKKRGIFYDPDVVDACVRLFREKGFEFKFS